MVEKLRRKFIRISMLSFSIVFVLSILSINIINATKSYYSVNDFLVFLSEDQKSLERLMNPIQTYISDKAQNAIEGSSKKSPFSKRDEQKHMSVLLDSSGKMVSIEDKFSMVGDSDDKLSGRIKSIYKLKKDRGVYHGYMYLKDKIGEYDRIILVDLSTIINQIKGFAFASIVILVICESLVYALIRFFSKKAIKPILENIEKQRVFIDNASHEIKTPLAIISANNDVAEITEGETEWTISTRNQIKRLNSLVEEMLILSKYEEDNKAVEIVSIDLTSFVNKIIDEFYPAIVSGNIDFEKDIDKDVYTNYNLDDMRSIVSLLLENAIKYVDEPKKIFISLKNRELNKTEKLAVSRSEYSIKLNSKFVCLSINNTCEGISKEDMEHIFDKFYRVDKSRSRNSGGNGLGLSIGKMIAKKNNSYLIAYGGEGDITFLLIKGADM